MSVKGRIVALGKLLVTVVMLALVISAVGVEALAEIISRPDPAMLLLAICVLLLQLAVMAWRWQVLLDFLFGKRVGFAPLILSIGQSMLASQALPATIGGDVYRVALVSGRLGAAAAVRSVVCDRIMALAVLVALTVALVPVMLWRLGPNIAVLSVGAVSAAALLAFGAVVIFAARIATVPIVGNALSQVAKDTRRVLLGGAQGHLVSALGLGTHLLAVVLVYTLALSVEMPLALLDCLLIVPPALLVSSLPVSLGGWGVREGAFLGGFTLVGADAASAVTTSFFFGLSGIVVGAFSALFAFAHDERIRREVR